MLLYNSSKYLDKCSENDGFEIFSTLRFGLCLKTRIMRHATVSIAAQKICSRSTLHSNHMHGWRPALPATKLLMNFDHAASELCPVHLLRAGEMNRDNFA